MATSLTASSLTSSCYCSSSFSFPTTRQYAASSEEQQLLENSQIGSVSLGNASTTGQIPTAVEPSEVVEQQPVASTSKLSNMIDTLMLTEQQCETVKTKQQQHQQQNHQHQQQQQHYALSARACDRCIKCGCASPQQQQLQQQQIKTLDPRRQRSATSLPQQPFVPWLSTQHLNGDQSSTNSQPILSWLNGIKSSPQQVAFTNNSVNGEMTRMGHKVGYTTDDLDLAKSKHIPSAHDIRNEKCMKCDLKSTSKRTTASSDTLFALTLTKKKHNSKSIENENQRHESFLQFRFPDFFAQNNNKQAENNSVKNNNSKLFAKQNSELKMTSKKFFGSSDSVTANVQSARSFDRQKTMNSNVRSHAHQLRNQPVSEHLSLRRDHRVPPPPPPPRSGSAAFHPQPSVDNNNNNNSSVNSQEVISRPSVQALVAGLESRNIVFTNNTNNNRLPTVDSNETANLSAMHQHQQQRSDGN